MHNFFDTFPRPLLILDRDSRIVALNHSARTLDWPEGTPPGELPPLLAALTDRPEQIEALKGAFNAARSTPGTCQRVTLPTLRLGPQEETTVNLWAIAPDQVGIEWGACPGAGNSAAAGNSSRERWLETEIERVIGKVNQLVEQLDARQAPGSPDPTIALRPRLSKRQKQLLNLIYAGKSSKDIAKSLRIGVATVISHRRALMRKLEAHSSAELIQTALKYGFFEHHPPA